MAVFFGTGYVGCHKFFMDQYVGKGKDPSTLGLIKKIKVYFNRYQYCSAKHDNGNCLVIKLDPLKVSAENFISFWALSFRGAVSHPKKRSYVQIDRSRALEVVNLLYDSNTISEEAYNQIRPVLSAIEHASKHPVIDKITAQQIAFLRQRVNNAIIQINLAAPSKDSALKWLNRAAIKSKHVGFEDGGRKNLDAFFKKKFPVYQTTELMNALLDVRKIALGIAGLESDFIQIGESVPKLVFQHLVLRHMVENFWDIKKVQRIKLS
jgi:hypothetical protein